MSDPLLDGYDKMRADYERMRDAECAKIIDEWKSANGYDDLLKAHAEAVAERDRLRELLGEVQGSWPYVNCVCGRSHAKIPGELRNRIKAALGAKEGG